jgi:microcystin-dependent protein
MPNLTLITLTPPSLPVSYCPLNYQNLANDIIGGTQAVFNSTIGNSFFNFGPTFPAINNRIYPWLDQDGQWWIFDQGFWVYKNTVAANGYDRRIFVGTTTDLLSYDGGDGTSGTPTNYTGAMWMVDTLFDARFPVGVGAFAASGAVAVNGTATATSIVGEDQHLLTTAEMPTHTHQVSIKTFGHGGNDGDRVAADGGTSSPTLTNNVTAFPSSTLDPDVDAIAANTGGNAAHNNLPPFYGVYFIKRTSRIYYTK